MTKRFHTVLITSANTATITDIRTNGKLNITFTGKVLKTCDDFLDFINELQECLWEKKTLILELFGESHIYFDWMIVLDGSVSLRDCELHNTDLENVKLSNVNVRLWKNAIIKYSEMENQVLQHEGGDLMVRFCSSESTKLSSLFSDDTLIMFDQVHTR
ncbi:hypothetical protein PS2_0007 [Aeromonas phage PS2]|uniref:Uncharacterized protein n=1 Tax=Aeromonas phage PS1 TaxID=2591406 RepID=A0A514TUR5_9CAUD|nr:hypothetical protein PQC64_gp007 [Aeromonas phage PS1]QDJ96765.1 hypothetical protein PS1_0007 [Aeromonas phage PS1]QFR59398.1 hypothetical protein PS2_0007 [Aeromonas phage PS2]